MKCRMKNAECRHCSRRTPSQRDTHFTPLNRIGSVSEFCILNYRSLLRCVAAVLRRTGARRSHEQLAAVSERQVAAVGAVRSVLGAVAVNDGFGSLWK